MISRSRNIEIWKIRSLLSYLLHGCVKHLCPFTMPDKKDEKKIQEPLIDIEKIKAIDFNSEDNKKAFDQIEMDNAEILKSVRVSYESLKLRFEI